MPNYAQYSEAAVAQLKHEIFTPIKIYPPMTVRELACSHKL
ncbi:hypothetical protein [Polaromonas vacuolata]|nr:hypothetical protein [Polaromonas vacuolata]